MRSYKLKKTFQKKIIFIRADGSNEIGLGHIVRCQALALMLNDEFDINFVFKELPIEVTDEIANNGFKAIKIDSEIDFFKFLTKNEIVVIDHYGLDTNYQKRIKKIGSKLVCIDDLHDKEFYADLIINHAEGVVNENYTCKKYTQLYLGINYALLRKPFLVASLVEKKNVKAISKCFVCFGGSDFENYTLDTVKKLIQSNLNLKINIVIGSSYLYYNDLKSFCHTNNLNEITIFRNLNSEELLKVMIDSDLAIVPSSSILYEVLSVKIPIITGYTVENQKNTYQSLINKGVAIGINSFPIDNINEKFKLVDTLKDKMLINQNDFYDGKSPERILKIFKDL